MADPVTLATVSMGASAGGSIIGAIGNIFKGDAQSQMYEYQSGIATMNQKINLRNADYERVAGETQAQISGMKTAAQVGATTAAQAGSGLDVNRGSAVAVRQSETEIGQFDQAMIRSNASRRAYGYEVEAAQDAAQAKLAKMAADTSKTSGILGAITSILGGATSVSDKYLAGQQKGIFPA